MSARRQNLDIAPIARIDYQGLLTYSVGEWGEEQARIYQRTIDRVLDDLLEFPDSGRPHPEFFPGCRTRIAGDHMIYYRLVGTDTVEIVRILHQRMDARRQFRRRPNR